MPDADQTFTPIHHCRKCNRFYPETSFFKDYRHNKVHRAECKQCTYKRTERARIKRKFGITYDEYEQWAARLDHRCEICGKQYTRLCIDHCHTTNKVRGLLCSACNRSIGHLGDTAESLQRAADYLHRTSK